MMPNYSRKVSKLTSEIEQSHTHRKTDRDVQVRVPINTKEASTP